MGIIGFLLNLVLSGVAGYIAGRLMNANFSILKSVLIGLVGGFVGSLLFSLIGLSATGLIGGMLVSVVGACLCIWLVRKFGH